VILGFEHGTYNVSESDDSTEVCVHVKSGIVQNFLTLFITTVDGDAYGEQCCSLWLPIYVSPPVINQWCD